MQTLSKSLVIIIFLSFLSCSYSQKHESTDNTITDSKQITIPDYEIKFPITEFKVKKTEKIKKTPTEDILITNWILEGKDENGPFMYFVAHNKVPQELKTQMETDPTALDIALKASLMGSATKLGGKNFKFTEIKYSDYKGMESICDVFDGKGIIKSRIFKIEDNLFVISAGGKNISHESVQKFLDSFKLKN